jgi:hypothetical protein
MGKWYLGAGAEKFGHMKSFKEMDSIHASVHDSVLKNLEFVKSQTVLKGDNPKTISNNFAKMEQASDTLFHQLDNIVEEYMKK